MHLDQDTHEEVCFFKTHMRAGFLFQVCFINFQKEKSLLYFRGSDQGLVLFRFLIGAEQDSSSRASDWQPARSISVVSFPNTEIKSSAQSISNASRNRRTCTDSFQFVEQRIESVSCWRGYGHGGGGAAAAAAGRRES